MSGGVRAVICEGCGRRAGAGERSCPACGRPLPGAEASDAPLGWVTAPLAVTGPGEEGEPAGAAAVPAEDEDESSLFLPEAVRAERGHAREGAGGPPPDRASRPVDLPGGTGWRVRASAFPAAPEAATPAEAAAPPRPPRASLPGWVYPVLVGAILATSLGAALLVALHVLRRG